jgi:hypothetical protein
VEQTPNNPYNHLVKIYKTSHVNSEIGKKCVFSSMSSIHNMSSIFTKFEQQGLKKTVEKSKKLRNTTLDPSLHFDSPNHKCSFKLSFWF